MFGLGLEEIVVLMGLSTALVACQRLSRPSGGARPDVLRPRRDEAERLRPCDDAQRETDTALHPPQATAGVYRSSRLREPRASRDWRVARAVGLGVAGVLLALAALWIAVTTGLFSKPSAATLAPVVPSVLCALRAASMTRRLWRGRRRVVAGAVGALAALALVGAGLATMDYLTGEEPQYPSTTGWTLWHC